MSGTGRPSEFVLPSTRDTRRARPTFWSGILVSVGAHGLVFAFTSFTVPGLSGGGSGSRPLEVIAVQSSRSVQVEPAAPRRQRALPERPDLAIDAPGVDARDVLAANPGFELELAPYAARPPGPGRGLTRGDAEGDGRRGDGLHLPAVARSILPDWRAPRSIQGTEILVRVRLDAFGNPTGAVELDPPTTSRRMNRRIVDRVLMLRYRPAVRDGEFVDSWAEIGFSFCPSGVAASSPPAPRSGRPCAFDGETAGR